MVTREELDFLYWLVREHLQSRGALLEIGPWLGGTTSAIATAIQERDEAGEVLAVDDFLWEDYMTSRSDEGLEVGDSFLARFETFMDGLPVVPVKAALPDDPSDLGPRDPQTPPIFEWPGDAPIEMLFIDGAKSLPGMLHLMREVGSELIEGALIVAQDYLFWGAWWVPSTLELHADSLRLQYVLSRNMVSFQVLSPLKALPLEPDRDALVSALERAIRRLDNGGYRSQAQALMTARVRMFADLGEIETSLAALAELDRHWPWREPDDNLVRAADWLQATHGRGHLSPIRTNLRRLFRRGIAKLVSLKARSW